MGHLTLGEKMLALIPVLVIAAAAIYAVSVILRGIARKIHNKGAPVKTLGATVLSRRTETRRSMVDSVDQYALQFNSFYVTFQLSNGKQVELAVPPGKAESMAEGAVGRLTAKGSDFISFVQ